MVDEIWKDIPNYEGTYKINNFGEIRRYNTYSTYDKRIPKYHNIKAHIGKSGYYRVVLNKNNKAKNYLVHRLVAQAFIPNPNNLPQINHKDENKGNNSVNNLEWCTLKYNCNYGTRTQRIADKLKIMHKGKHFSKQNEFKKGQNAKKVINITTNKIYNSMQDAMKDTGIFVSNICNCCKGNIKTAGGYIWKYQE